MEEKLRVIYKKLQSIGNKIGKGWKKGVHAFQKTGLSKALNRLWKKFRSYPIKKQIIYVVVLIAVIVSARAIVHKVNDNSGNYIELIASESETVTLTPKQASEYNWMDLVKKSAGKVQISGTIDKDNYEKQKLTFTSVKGTSKKSATIYVQIEKSQTQSKIVLKNDVVNVETYQAGFSLSDVVESVTNNAGEDIEFVDEDQLYYEKLSDEKNVAYFYGTECDMGTVGAYLIQLVVLDENGYESDAYFVVNVTKDKETADNDIETVRKKLYKKGGALHKVEQSDNVTINEEIVDPLTTSSSKEKDQDDEKEEETTASDNSSSSDDSNNYNYDYSYNDDYSSNDSYDYDTSYGYDDSSYDSGYGW